MTLKELLDLANAAYPDGQLAEYYDVNGNFVDNKHGGDGLARFIVVEITETYDAKASKTRQVEEAMRVMARARDDIEEVLRELYKHR